jgi:integrase/recombinase XerC
MNDLIPALGGPPPWASASLVSLVEDSRSPATAAAYAADVRTFFAFLGGEATPESVAALCSLSGPDLSQRLYSYRAELRRQSLSPATVNRRLAAVRSLLRLARQFGAPIPDPSGLIPSEKVRRYRDTRGPSLADGAKLLASIDTDTLKGKRDLCLLLLLSENALRRGELCQCNIADFSPGESTLRIVGKGSGGQAEPITISDRTVEALNFFVDARRDAGESVAGEAPLLPSYQRGGDSRNRLTGRGLHHIVGELTEVAIGRRVNPHALRHMAITAVLDATGGDIRAAQELARHADPRTTLIYDDNRKDAQGKATRLLSELLSGRE